MALPVAPQTIMVFQRSRPAAPVRLGVWARSYERNHPSVRSAFGKVVSVASRSTVRVSCDGREKAFGAIIHADGYVLTKHSELTGTKITCRLKDGRSFPAELVGVDRDTDLAMLGIQTRGLTPIRFSDKEPPPVGSWVATPGLGDSPVAIGIVSARQRRMAVSVGVLGVLLGDAESGPGVEEVLPGSAALRAGVQRGDVILQVNDRPTKDRRALVEAIRSHHPGEIVALHVLRGKTTKVIRAKLRIRADDAPPGSLDHQNRMGGNISDRRTGFPLVLQHDSVLDPSHCGGPLVDLDGDVVGINIARAGRVASLSLPAGLVVGLLDDLKSGKLAPPQWSVGLRQSRQDALNERIASLEVSLSEAQRARSEAQRRLLQSEATVRRALVEKAAAELRKVDAQQDTARKMEAEADRRAAEQAVRHAEAPFEQARKEVAAVDRTIRELRAALAAARRERAELSENDAARASP
jgi:serine protease Do